MKRNALIILLVLLAPLSCDRRRTETSAPIAPARRSCATEGIPEITAIYTAEGVLLWDNATGFPTRNILYDAIEIHGENLCSGTLTIADGYLPATNLAYTVVDQQNLRINLRWDFPRVDNSILFRTKRSFSRIDITLLPIDELNLSRQIYINRIKSQNF